MSEDKQHRADRWRQFHGEDGGLADVITKMRHAYFQRHAVLGITADDQSKRHVLALADKILGEIDQHIKGIIASGDIDASREHVRRIEELPKAKRRWI